MAPRPHPWRQQHHQRADLGYWPAFGLRRMGAQRAAGLELGSGGAVVSTRGALRRPIAREARSSGPGPGGAFFQPALPGPGSSASLCECWCGRGGRHQSDRHSCRGPGTDQPVPRLAPKRFRGLPGAGTSQAQPGHLDRLPRRPHPVRRTTDDGPWALLCGAQRWSSRHVPVGRSWSAQGLLPLHCC